MELTSTMAAAAEAWRMRSHGGGMAAWRHGGCGAMAVVAEAESTEVTALRESAWLGGPHCQNNLAVALYNGRGCEKNLEAAFVLFRRAAAQGLADAECSLGSCYAHGEGVAQNDENAATFYRRSAQHGNIGGMNNWATCLAQGTGVAQDLEQAVAWYREAAEAGVAFAQTNLGNCYMTGAGVEEVDWNEAAVWFQEAAEQGEAIAEYNLATMYNKGGHGLEQNQMYARELLIRGVNKKYAPAVEALRNFRITSRRSSA